MFTGGVLVFGAHLERRLAGDRVEEGQPAQPDIALVLKKATGLKGSVVKLSTTDISLCYH